MGAVAQQAPRAPHAPGVKQGGVATKKHWRLVAEAEVNGQPVKRKPLTKVRYTSPDLCARDGSLLPPPPPRDEELHIFYLIRCLAYTTADTDTETPIGGEVQ